MWFLYNIEILRALGYKSPPPKLIDTVNIETVIIFVKIPLTTRPIPNFPGLSKFWPAKDTGGNIAECIFVQSFFIMGHKCSIIQQLIDGGCHMLI